MGDGSYRFPAVLSSDVFLREYELFVAGLKDLYSRE
jgi:hypothetical protein